MSDQYLVSLSTKLAAIEANQVHMLAAIEEVKGIAMANRRDINLAKGGSVFATLAVALLGAVTYMKAIIGP
jgi:hypothetical protein